MNLTQIKASDIDFSKNIVATTKVKGWDVNISGTSKGGYHADIYVVNEGIAKDYTLGCLVFQGSLRNLYELKDWVREYIADLDITSFDAKNICAKHDLSGINLEELIDVKEHNRLLKNITIKGE